MELSVIVTNYKTPELLKLCLKSIKENLAGLDYEVFVMDAQSDEDTEYVAKEKFPEYKFTPFEKNVGFTALVNDGLKVSGGKYVLILNSDIILTNGSVQKMIEYLDRHEDVGIIGPQLLNLDGSVQESCRRFFGPLTILASRTVFGKTGTGKKLLDRFLMRGADHNLSMPVDWLLGSALLVRQDAMKKINLMDSRFFMYLGDVDWCLRFWRAGFKIVYFPEAKIYHYHLRVSKKAGGLADLFINKYTWIHIADAVKYFLKHGLKIPDFN